MKKRLQRLLAALMSVVFIMSTITVNAAETHHIEWYVKQNAAGQAANYPNNWPFKYEYFDVSSKSFKAMEQHLGDNGWADSTTSAVVKPWEQVATDSKYAVVIYYATQKGTLTLQNRQNFSGTGQVMLLQKNEAGNFAVLKDWTNAGTTWADATTYVNANESVYFIYRATSGSSVASFVPQVVHDKGVSDIQNKYPTTWKAINELLFPSEEPQVPTQTSEISWFVTQNATGQAANYPTNWPFNYEYFDVASKQFKTMEKDLGANGWADTTEATLVTPWTQKATDEKYAAVVYYATQKGTVKIQNKKNATLNGYDADGQIMLLQKKTDGTFSVLQDWKDIKKDGTLAWTEVTTYLNAGEMIYFVYRSTSDTKAQVQNLTPQVTQYLGNEDTQNQYPTEWKGIADIMFPAPPAPPAPPTETWAGDISWYVTQWAQPWEGSPFTFEYFDASKMEFHELEAWNRYESPAYWQDATGTVRIKGWEMIASNVKYAATTFNAEQQGTVELTNNITVSGSGADGEFMLLQKNAEGKYAVLLDWISVPAGQVVTLPNVSTYVQGGDIVYYLYRSASEGLAVGGITPGVVYVKGALDSEQQYPTEWKELDDIFEKKEAPDETSAVKYYEIKTNASAGGSIVAMNGSNAVGKDLTYQFVPQKSYQVADVIVDGVSLGKTSRYTFTELRDNHTIQVKFEKNTDNVVAWIGTGKDEQDA